jgi:hypothetical protein
MTTPKSVLARGGSFRTKPNGAVKWVAKARDIVITASVAATMARAVAK